MSMRKKLNKKQSKKMFRNGYKKTEFKNIASRPMRGGVRL